ncbi:hypothetical protein HQ865_24690 [Mucilaginibacter mali]|uniref:S-layer family protein n=1 Tax=Mucilaginibacter mali TaxID=2740462 RepID=A0A7D4U0B6_9SPHI|nr:hypothetical protein [Mucilaginibacter mali]QKJ32817.1 hypothetical protein HQ865_24690 [Mucilaginibacter mali]
MITKLRFFLFTVLFFAGLAAYAQNENGRFVCLYGMEYGMISHGGHVVIYGSRKLIGWGPSNFDVFSARSDYASLFRIVAADPKMFATLAHPAQTDYSNLAAQPYNLTAHQAVCGVAVSRGPAFSKKADYSDRPPMSYYSYYKKLLSLGYSVGPTMDHDNHNTTFGRMSAMRTAVLVQVLNRDSIIAAYKANRFYATEDGNVKVDFTINGMPLGSYIRNSGNLVIKVAVTDPGSGGWGKIDQADVREAGQWADAGGFGEQYDGYTEQAPVIAARGSFLLLRGDCPAGWRPYLYFTDLGKKLNDLKKQGLMNDIPFSGIVSITGRSTGKYARDLAISTGTCS